MLGALLGGLFDHAGKPTPANPQPDGQNPADLDTATNSDVVSKTTLDEWSKLPNELLWDAIEKDAFASGREWSVKTWAFVTAALSKLLTQMAGSGRVPDFAALRVDDATVQADFATWRDIHDLDARWIFDQSQTPPGQSVIDIGELAVRAVRIDFLARVYALANEMLEDEGI